MFRTCLILAVLVMAPLIEALDLCVDDGECLRSPGQSPNGNGPVDTLYNPAQPVGTVTVGTKYNQSFEAVFDTGSYQTWFTTTGITGYAETGTPLHQNGSIVYGGNFTVEGPLYLDDVAFDGFTAKNIQVMAAQSTAFNATLGMGYWTKSTIGVAGFFETLIEQKSVTKPEFGLHLGRTNTPEKSSLTLGSRDSTKHTGEFVSVPVIQQGGWSIQIDGYSVNGKMLNSTTPVGTIPNPPLVDTGTPYINALHNAAVAIHSAIPGAVPADDTGNVWKYPCNTSEIYMPTLILSGTSLSIAPEDFNMGSAAGDGMCESAIRSPLAYGWVLGSPWLMSFYTVFHWGLSAKEWEVGNGTSVNFAPAVHQPARSQHHRLGVENVSEASE
ncbi:hypothetical protein HO133_004924 [Letharia lupina]|uniref:Peptidase A1 domain-containing protein n=1 Tax=Letharia lupina TaxID=560253 RepID=A0A8H6C9E4_9LECA|nr:uncharacterized protein HO133_004924 [Letharia lupina]KAF6219099.1 hypothetical protein HO133_004924 [Letharia lupina]